MNLSFSLNTQRIYRIAVSVFFFIAGLSFSSWASRIPDIKNKLHLSEAALGSVLLALPVGLMASLPISGLLVSRFGSKRVAINAALLYPLTLTLLGAVSATWQLVLVLFFFGMWGNLVNIAMNTQAVGVEKIYGKSIMASFHGLWSLAGFTGAAVGAFFVSLGIFPLIHFTIICAATAGLVLASYKSMLPHDNSNNNQPLFAKPDRSILILGMIAFCCMICEGAMADWSGVYFQKVVQTSPALITLGYVAFTSTMATGRFIADRFVTKFGAKKMLQISGALITTGLLIAVIFPYMASAIAGFLLVGFGVSAVVPIVYSQAGKSKTMSPGIALASVSTIGFIGFLLGPPMIGFIAQASNLRWSFSLIALLGFGTFILARKIRT